ncbi:MAG: hypothetical protein GY874_18290 [Desulfobacteraceae bacterium]|nr:hypothetical protein [Desulfobacteraceae bacterium]
MRRYFFMSIPKPDFKILALGPFTMDSANVWNQKPITVDRLSLDAIIERLNIKFFLELNQDLSPQGGTHVHIKSFKSLHPDGIVQTQPYFKQLSEAESYIDQALKKGISYSRINQKMSQWHLLPSPLLPAEQPAKTQTGASEPSVSLKNILNMVALSDHKKISKPGIKNPAAALKQRALSALFELAEFKNMEAAWRGLRLLLQQGISKDNIKVQIAAFHPETMQEAMHSLTPELLKDTPNVILADLAFGNSALCMERLAQLAQWAETLMAPIITWFSADFFQIETWNQLSSLSFIPNHIQSPEYAKFRKIQESSAGRWLCAAGNRFLIRYPYGKDNPARHVNFTETGHLWAPPVWAAGTLIAKSVCHTGWPTCLSDRNRFMIEDLALFNSGEQSLQVVESHLTHDRLDQMARAGLSFLSAEKGRDKAYLPKAVTVSKDSLAYQLFTSQIIRFVLWCKDYLPAEDSPAALQTQLKLAFQVYNEQSHPQAFESVEVSTIQNEDDKTITVKFSIIASSSLIGNRRPIEFSLRW